MRGGPRAGEVFDGVYFPDNLRGGASMFDTLREPFGRH